MLGSAERGQTGQAAPVSTAQVAVAISTCVLQLLAVLGVIFLFFRWRAEEANRGRQRLTADIV
jgi:hypothetical protein